jgi:16S rRNA (cytidine1402-2'-O)-methyltransferase
MELYLLPTPLSRGEFYWEYPLWREVVQRVSHFFVERIARLRPLLLRAGLSPEAHLYEIEPQSGDWPWEAYAAVFERRLPAALVSEAGLPGVADVGTTVVRRAHAEGYAVIPLAGPSSLTLALAASGLSGQRFTFWGYPPIEKRKRYQFLQKVFQAATESTQILMETPGRTQALFEEILQRAPHTLLLCVAHNLTSPTGFVHTYPIPQWEGQTLPKAPTLFLLGR